MISKEELLKQKTKRDIDMETLERDIDNNLKNITPDTIVNRTIVIKVVNSDYNEDTIQKVLDKYVEHGGYNQIEYEKGTYGYNKTKMLDITFKF